MICYWSTIKCGWGETRVARSSHHAPAAGATGREHPGKGTGHRRNHGQHSKAAWLNVMIGKVQAIY